MGGNEHGSTTDRTLTEMLRAEAVTIGDAVRIAAGAADRVAALHARGRALGDVGPDTVLVDASGAVSLAGTPATRLGATAPAAVREDDLRGTGRVLAAGLGWADDRLPEPIARLIDRALEADAPASALALALHRLELDPLTVAALLPPQPVPVQRTSGLRSLVELIVPRTDRRTAGVAAGALGVIAALGAVLLLVGTPGSTGAPPRAVAALDVRPDVAAPAPVAVAPEATSVAALLHPVGKTAPSAVPAAVVRSTPVQVQVEVAGPTAPPTSGPAAPPVTTAPSTPAPTAPAPTASAEPTAPATADPQPTAPAESPVPSSEPPAPPSSQPDPTAAPITAAPSAPPTAQPGVQPTP